MASTVVTVIPGLIAGPSPGDDDIDNAMDGNACRCATYVRIRDAVKLAAQKLEV